MTTAAQIVNAAAEDLEVKTAEMPLEAADFQVFFDRMNDMLLEWADIGLTPAFTEVFNGSDTVSIEPNARAAVKSNLAIRCASAFQKQVTMALAETASSSLSRLEASTAFIDVQFPGTLPLGSGNDCPSSYLDDRFFQTQNKENF